jgi:S1-C subfamily serine protease
MFQAVIVGSDPRIDLVVLKIEGSDFMTLPMGDSEELDVGDLVLAVGNPYGFGHTVTRGIVSAVNRSGVGLHPYEDFIQSDVAVNMGNSGGALINSRAELVGINSAIISKTGGFQGISLATPINLVKEALPYLIRGDPVSRGWLGVQVMVLPTAGAVARQLGYTGDLGLVVTGIEPGSPAQQAGIEPADVFIKIDGKLMKAPRDFKRAVTSRRAGDSIDVIVWRRGKETPLKVTLGEMPYREQPAAE